MAVENTGEADGAAGHAAGGPAPLQRLSVDLLRTPDPGQGPGQAPSTDARATANTSQGEGQDEVTSGLADRLASAQRSGPEPSASADGAQRPASAASSAGTGTGPGLPLASPAPEGAAEALGPTLASLASCLARLLYAVDLRLEAGTTSLSPRSAASWAEGLSNAAASLAGRGGPVQPFATPRGEPGYATADRLAIAALQHLGYVHSRAPGFMGCVGLRTEGAGSSNPASPGMVAPEVEVLGGPGPYGDVSLAPPPSVPFLRPDISAQHLLAAGWEVRPLLELVEAIPLPGEPPAEVYGPQLDLAEYSGMTQQEQLAMLRRLACAALLWRRCRVSHVRGNLMIKGQLPAGDKEGQAGLAACGGNSGGNDARAAAAQTAALAIYRRGLMSVRHSLHLHEACAEAHKYAVIVLSKSHGGDTRAKIAGAHTMRHHASRAVALAPLDPVKHHVLGVWCYEVAGLSWAMRQLATALFGSPPTSSYEEAYGHLAAAEDLCTSGRGVGPEGKPVGPWMTNRLKLAQTCYAMNRKDEARRWLGLALQLVPGPSEDEQAVGQARDLAKSLGVQVPPGYGQAA